MNEAERHAVHYPAIRSQEENESAIRASGY